MARINTVQTNFTAGEVSPRVLGRVDIAKYQNGADTMENAYVMVHGGAVRAPGSRFIKSAKNAAKLARLLPFVYSATVAYVIEVGDQYMRFYKDRAQITSGGPAYEISTPYTEADLWELNYVQSANTMFIVHPRYAVRRLTRYDDASWKLAVHRYAVEPHDEIGQKPATILTLGAVSGTGISATGAAACFQPSDVGRPLSSGTGYARIVGYTSTTVVTVDIDDAFSGVALASGGWTLEESPKTTLTPSGTITLGGTATLTLAAAGWRNDAQVTDIGRYVHINGGVVEITGYTSTTVVTGIVRRALTGTTAAPADSWSLESKVWGASSGYPRAVTLCEQRLVLAGTTTYPNTVWASQPRIYDDFCLGAADDDGLAFELVSDQQNPILQLAPLAHLIPLTFGNIFSMRGGTEKPLTPTNVRAKDEQGFGAANVRPVKVGNEALYVQRAGRRIRSLSYRVELDAYPAPDISVLSEHITQSGIVDMAYVQEPESIVAMVRDDGALVFLTINRDQEVLAWTRRLTDGYYEAVCAIPYGDIDQLWGIVRREINGSTVRYVELVEFNREPDDNLQTDCCVVSTGAASATWAGFSHLERETVDVLGDGIVFPSVEVVAGSITLPREVSSIEAGLHYTTTIVTLPPEMQLPEGAVLGRPVSISEVTVKLYRSIGCKIEGERLPFRRFGSSALDGALEPFTGDKRVTVTGWERGRKLTIVQDQPLPLCVLAVAKRISVGD